MANRTAIINNMENLSIEELQKIKIKEEIMSLKKPFWRQIQFLSIVVTMLIAFTGTSITLWQIQADKIEYAETEKSKYQAMMKELLSEKNFLKEKTAEANIKMLEALSEKTTAVSEKSDIKNQINSLKEIQLGNREKYLNANIQRLEKINSEYESRNKGYKEGFIESFVSKNETVQKDIYRFAKEGTKSEMEVWLKKQFLFTALNRYEKYLSENTKTFIPE
ncbi:MAG: hypothetical protein JWN56_1116 [Sphingobacteriales bacterium]|nr:hypothetical protein [Sphingobacteriales bacterium]